MHQADVDAGQREGSPRGNATSCESLKGAETPIVHAADTYSWMSPPNTSRRRTPTGFPLERPVGSCPSGVHGGSRGRARSPPLNGEEPNSDPRGPSESSSRRSEPDRRAERPGGRDDVHRWADIRRLHFPEGMGIKAIARRLGLVRHTVRAALRSDEPPAYRRARVPSKLDPFKGRSCACSTRTRGPPVSACSGPRLSRATGAASRS